MRQPDHLMRDFLRLVKNEIGDWVSSLLRGCPGRIGSKLRYHFYKHRLAGCGQNVRIAQGCYIRDCKNIELGSNVGLGIGAQIYAGGGGMEKIRIGSDVALNSNVMINADLGGKIEIGSHCLVGPNVVFRTSNHIYSDRTIPIREQGHKPGTIIVKDNVWIGANAVIAGNVVIGSGAIIAACSFVTKNVKDFAIVGGVPAEQIWMRS